jgi:hypothetical protein
MKTIMKLSILILPFIFMLYGCGKSDEQVKKIASLESELSQLQMQYRAQIPELNKAAWQIDSLINCKDKTALIMANDIHTAQVLVTTAFKPCDYEFLPTFQIKFEELPKALEGNISYMKCVIEKTETALSRSHEVMNIYYKQKGQRNK